MITVIIAGGSGTRLWPLSTNDYPKHLLNIAGDETLLQSTYRRAKRLSEEVYIATGSGHTDHIREQLPDLADDHFIIEPDRRETAGCFVLALHHLQSRHDNDEPIAFLHADHCVRDIEGFAQSFRTAQEVSKEQGKITLVGIEPTYAATGFGYIQKNGALDEDAIVYEVKQFQEKPDFPTARRYMQSGKYLWNAGYFVGSINTFLATMQEYAPDLKQNYDSLMATTDHASRDAAFLAFDKIAIDYALMEKAKNLLVVPAAFDWADLGSFADAHKVLETDQSGNYLHGYVETDNVENSYIRNDDGTKPVAVIGLDNIVVVNTPHGILVARKDLSQNVKAIAQKVQEKAKGE